MAREKDTPPPYALEEAITVPFCLVDDAYRLLNPAGVRRHEGLKRLSDSEVLALALLQQLWGVKSQRSFLRDAARFFADLFPGVVGLAPSYELTATNVVDVLMVRELLGAAGASTRAAPGRCSGT